MMLLDRVLPKIISSTNSKIITAILYPLVTSEVSIRAVPFPNLQRSTKD